MLNEHFAGTYDAFLVLSYNGDGGLTDFRANAVQLLDQAAAAGADVETLRSWPAQPLPVRRWMS